jgi:orotate phosphoribosyltransferase
MTISAEVFSVSREELRHELAADLSRGGYVFGDKAGSSNTADRYFDKHLVLSRPGLLTRSARLLADLVPAETERIAVVGVAAGTLATALSQQTGIPLLLGRQTADGSVQFDGERYTDIKCLLLEDVVFTGQQALLGAQALAALDAAVLGVTCLLDRGNGGAQRLAESGFSLRALFLEAELLRLAHEES